MNITKTITTLTTWLNQDTDERIQYESDTDYYYLYDTTGQLIAAWESKQNDDIIKLCATGVNLIWIGKRDYITNAPFVHFVLTSKNTIHNDEDHN
jgi:hypothetical protein